MSKLQLLLSKDNSTYNPVQFTYTKRGEVATRRAVMTSLSWGSNEWHPDPQWLIEGFDLDKGAVRTYSLIQIKDVRAPDKPQRQERAYKNPKRQKASREG